MCLAGRMVLEARGADEDDATHTTLRLDKSKSTQPTKRSSSFLWKVLSEACEADTNIFRVMSVNTMEASGDMNILE